VVSKSELSLRSLRYGSCASRRLLCRLPYAGRQTLAEGELGLTGNEAISRARKEADPAWAGERPSLYFFFANFLNFSEKPFVNFTTNGYWSVAVRSLALR
jgi:hypothetical protein